MATDTHSPNYSCPSVVVANHLLSQERDSSEKPTEIQQTRSYPSTYDHNDILCGPVVDSCSFSYEGIVTSFVVVLIPYGERITDAQTLPQIGFTKS